MAAPWRRSSATRPWPCSAFRTCIGRCLPYGEGITYWPLGEIVRQLSGADPHDSIAAIVGGEEAAFVGDGVVGAISLRPAGGSWDEIPLAARKLFEAVAQETVMAVVDDIHRAESSLLDCSSTS